MAEYAEETFNVIENDGHKQDSLNNHREDVEKYRHQPLKYIVNNHKQEFKPAYNLVVQERQERTEKLKQSHGFKLFQRAKEQLRAEDDFDMEM